MVVRNASWIGACVLLLTMGWAARATADEILIREGIDSSPYSFFPSLARGLRDSQYAFTDEDEDGFTHNFRTFIRFDLPPDLLAPGETVLEAYAWVYYSFDFTGFGDATDVPGEVHCHEVLESWDEIRVTWARQPSFGPVLDVQPDIEGLGLVWCDVTELVRDWVTGKTPNHGLALTNPTARLIGFRSFEYVNRLDPDDTNDLPSLVISTGPVPTDDMDADGVPDLLDNCPETRNPIQQDGNDDGIGDACAFALADVNGDGFVDWRDRNELLLAMGSEEGEPYYEPFADIDLDGRVDAVDEQLFETLYIENETPEGGATATGGSSCGLIGIELLAVWALRPVLGRGRRR